MSASIPAGTLEKFTTFGDLLRFLRRRAGQRCKNNDYTSYDQQFAIHFISLPYPASCIDKRKTFFARDPCVYA
jgi:hypothetical protein